MYHFIEKLRLKEQADEDQYFARRDRELIAALHARRRHRIERVVSGGQTGVDRAALDVALDLGMPVGGWCPRGRLAEDGVIPARYPLRETPLADPAQRTEWNVRDSDGTLILRRGPVAGGTALTAELARRYGRPLLQLSLEEPDRVQPDRDEPDLDAVPDLPFVHDWLRGEGIRVLNVAGPRESEAPGITAAARDLIRHLLHRMCDGPRRAPPTLPSTRRLR
jgi:hypothetical protein